ncbi:MAG: hypothetical protein US83_C0012G0030 [Candidatus Falkowbacteria bacterium GW2011_GWC2_38_22]|uniref:Endolytic murein transglycosylase n=1 Tax=Candidatus Falkowbacteria bacterium GW2011_GWE1_38_31 TaxID=1618638 RepID=A0A0G0M7S5_9BACT|nr:MAG: hypothetical protein US73_C0010G0030 [Candidatus Falkowbacteria bacterium GW2011_GWF2_38_1205]KKQ60791.1 MAG: hypothetical protein US83_C0012G0030 [Candidatus Falkowbacteria bacterium GW2011_GWC2_38_22]KKQ62958.1 MAG: hypothetical protein US84_C0010G0030 [Candidatus Falkowbacteria bacterium GW2011_GWF1_38_22]KKQ64970.1 MAG: hypothetical protein US87_C0010G0030 [Candidatus Falkowbacteria bacterium GW2011_GWE2_38_254]KKQ69734.1 MAG: hypothetical protein US91_C0010G0030 [Candidatus Falkowb
MKKIILILIIIAFVLLGGFYFTYQYKINSGNGANVEEIVFSVESGEGVKTIADKLLERNLINSRAYFLLYVRNQKLEANFQAGDYVLNKAMPLKKIVSILTSGKAISKEKTIKIIEGWRIGDIAKYLEKEGITQEKKFSELANQPVASWPFAFDKPSFINEIPESSSLEGFLFPDTYRIFADADEASVIEKMLKNFDLKLSAEMRADIQKQGRSLPEIITMASIIEKEVRDYADMKIVSGLFWDRIKNGQALESCATLAFILGVDKPQYTIEDTQIDSPYNSYRNRGLPPGPISNPGLNAIKAAIYPEHAGYTYFLSRPDTGETVFSKTYDEHIRNKEKYLR